ncbi:MAG: glycosyltransferase [Patescibacteria group bacterium]|nr:glycosyltransferase [Patescibacteria group bacterium]
MGTNAKAKIAIVTPTFPPYRGGMGRVAEMDALQLTEAGYEVTVHVPTQRHGERRPERVAGYRIVEHRPWYRYNLAALVPTLGGLLNKNDLVIQHYPFFGAAEFTALGRRLAGKGHGRLATVYHMDTVGKGLVGAVAALHRPFCLPFIMNSADRVIVTSFDYLHTSQLAAMARRSLERFRELPLSVDTERFVPGEKPAELLARYGLKVEEPTVFFLGGLDRAHYFKGVPNLLKAMAMKPLAAARAVIAGSGDLKPEYEALAGRLGLANRVVFTGSVTEEELPLHYRLGDVFAFPSVDRSEAFGIAALESLSCGVPVVASDLPGVRTIVRHGDTGRLIAPGSVSALASRLAELLDDANERGRMGRNGRRMAVDEYDDKERAKRLRRIVAELLH